jgi:hypothetical protein
MIKVNYSYRDSENGKNVEKASKNKLNMLPMM